METPKLLAQAWTERVDYVECPHCTYLLDLGSDNVWPETEKETECESCKKPFIMLCPDDE